MPFKKGDPKKGGRKKGVPNRRTTAKVELSGKLASEGMSPLEVMLTAMREQIDVGNFGLAHSFAKDAAPYIHPRLAATEHTGKDKGPIEVQHTDAERLLAWEMFAAKMGK